MWVTDKKKTSNDSDSDSSDNRESEEGKEVWSNFEILWIDIFEIKIIVKYTKLKRILDIYDEQWEGCNLAGIEIEESSPRTEMEESSTTTKT